VSPDIFQAINFPAKVNSCEIEVKQQRKDILKAPYHRVHKKRICFRVILSTDERLCISPWTQKDLYIYKYTHFKRCGIRTAKSLNSFVRPLKRVKSKPTESYPLRNSTKHFERVKPVSRQDVFS